MKNPFQLDLFLSPQKRPPARKNSNLHRVASVGADGGQAVTYPVVFVRLNVTLKGSI